MKLLLITGILLCSLSLNGQEAMLKGFIYDNSTGEPVRYATIRMEGLEGGTTSDDVGFYILRDLPPGTCQIIFTSIGYDTLIVSLQLEETKTHIRDFYLSPKTYEMREVRISAERDRRESVSNISEYTILPDQINITPSAGSMPDLIQRLHTLPGIVSSGDLGGQIYIRGGSSVQNKVFLDGATIFNPVHSIGLFSVFDPDIISKADIYTGAFEARYGGAISSVLDITSRNGNFYRYSGKAEVSAIGSKVHLEGPVLNKKQENDPNISFMLNVRHCYFDKVRKAYYSYIDNKTPFGFTDYFGKTTLFAGQGFKASLFGYHFSDHAGIDNSPIKYHWNNKGFGSHFLIMPFRSHALIEGYFAVSGYKMNMEEKNYVPRKSNVGSVNFGMNFILYKGENNLKYGIDLLSMKTDYMFFSSTYNATQQLEYNTELSGYLQAHLKTGNLIIDPGFRAVLYSSLNIISPEPRIAMKYILSKRLRLKMASGLYSQNLISGTSDRDIVSFFTGYLSAPVNINDTPDVKQGTRMLQTAQHYVLGMENDFSDVLQLNSELFIKNYPQMISYNRNKLYNEIDFPDKPDALTKDFVYEKGLAYGADFSVSSSFNDVYLIMNYSFSKTNRSFEMPDGSTCLYFPHYDRRHNINLMASFKFGTGKSWLATFRWNFGTGFPFTKTLGTYESIEPDENAIINYLTMNGNLRFLYDEINKGRLPYYQRFDAAIKKYYLLSNNTSVEIEVNVINALNEKNIFYIDRGTGESAMQLPLLPGMRMSVRF